MIGANVGAELGHLGDAAGVVGDRAVGVDRHGDADGREHADRRDADAVEVRPSSWKTRMLTQMISTGSAQDSSPTASPAMMFGRRAGLRLVCDLPHRPRRGVVLGDQADHDAADGSDEGTTASHTAVVTALPQMNSRAKNRNRPAAMNVE